MAQLNNKISSIFLNNVNLVVIFMRIINDNLKKSKIFLH